MLALFGAGFVDPRASDLERPSRDQEAQPDVDSGTREREGLSAGPPQLPTESGRLFYELIMSGPAGAASVFGKSCTDSASETRTYLMPLVAVPRWAGHGNKSLPVCVKDHLESKRKRNQQRSRPLMTLRRGHTNRDGNGNGNELRDDAFCFRCPHLHRINQGSAGQLRPYCISPAGRLESRNFAGPVRERAPPVDGWRKMHLSRESTPKYLIELMSSKVITLMSNNSLGTLPVGPASENPAALWPAQSVNTRAT